MFKNYLKIAYRNLFRNKSQSAILVGGLTVGMAACILLLQYVSFELSFDQFHQKQEHIYRVVNERIQNGESVQKGTITYPTIGGTMKNEFPEIVNATRIAYSDNVIITQKDRIEPVEPCLWVDEHFLEIFDFELLANDGLKMLDETNELVLTRQIADQYFPSAKGNYEKVIGETLQIDTYQEPFKIVGVCENVPANSTLQFNLLLSYASCIRYWGEEAGNSWTYSDFYHFIELKPGTNVASLERKFTGFSERHFRGTEVSGSEEIFTLQPLAEAHLYSNGLEYEIGKTASGRAVWTLLVIAFFILLIAWINYVNLSSVRAIERTKEVGVRKVIGAQLSQLVGQFFTEALLVNVISLLLSLQVVQLVKPWFAANFGLDANVLGFMTFNHSGFHLYLPSVLLALIFVGVLVSGAYPAWLLSSSHVSNVLKGVFQKSLSGGGLRKGLVVFQFTLSIALIASTGYVSRQINYMSKQDLGINIDQVITVNPPEMSQWDSTFIDRMEAFKGALVGLPGVESGSTSNRAPGERMGRIFQMQKTGEHASDQLYTSNFINADHSYANTYGISPLAGRFFRRTDHNPDWNALENLVVTAATVKMLGYPSNEEAIGQGLQFWRKEWRIVGVVPDFHQRTLHHAIEPIIYIPSYATYNLLSLKVLGEDLDKTIADVKATYDSFFPGNQFHYEFVDEAFSLYYESDHRFGNILSFFTFLTILIACLGLFGLASYTTYLRTKEIGVRKILGASAVSIVGLLSKDFLKLVAIALVIASPLAWFSMNLYLNDFAYRIDMDWWVLALAGCSAILVAFLTVGFQSVKAALSNPVESLRSE